MVASAMEAMAVLIWLMPTSWARCEELSLISEGRTYWTVE